jgi:hypothetical protein
VAAGSSDLNTVLPATSTSAPALRIEDALSNVTPPSISISVLSFFSRDHFLERNDLIEGIGDELLAAETGVNTHQANQVYIV